jgi:hypothetical protein
MSRPKGSKNKKEPDFTTCPICGLNFKKQGIGTHMREKHQTVYKKVYQQGFNQQNNDKNEPFGELTKEVKEKGNNSHLPKQALNEITETNKELIAAEELKQYSFTEKDLFILQGKLFEVIDKYNDVNGLMAELKLLDDLNSIKRDFYQRFNTTENQLKRNHPGLFMDSTNIEEEMEKKARFLPYAKLKYSNE